MTKLIRLALVGGGILSAAASQAVIINFIWHGAYTPGASVIASNGAAGNQTVFDFVAGSVPITGVWYQYTEAAAGIGNANGNGFLWVANAAPNAGGVGAAFAFSFTGNNTADGMNGTVLTLNGIAAPYLGVSQTGQLSHTDHAYPNDPFGNTAGGQFSSVPEPASMLAVGVGLIGLIRRRATTLK